MTGVIPVPWAEIACPSCEAGWGAPCTISPKERDAKTKPCHTKRFNAAKKNLPKEVKARIHDCYCPTCLAAPGDPCEGSDGSWWHKGRDYTVLEWDGRSPSKATLTVAAECPRCGAAPGEPCFTKDYSDEPASARKGRPRPASHMLKRSPWHSEREVAAGVVPDRTQSYMTVACPKCGAKPGEPCVKTTVPTGDPKYPYRKRKKDDPVIESKRLHRERTAAWRECNLAEKEKFEAGQVALHKMRMRGG